MSPLSGLVLGAAAVVASPALWMAGVEGTLPLGDALTRYLISVVVCWAALSVVGSLAFPAPGTVAVRRDAAADEDVPMAAEPSREVA